MEDDIRKVKQTDSGVFSSRLEALISAALQDGVLTEKEKTILKKRVEAEGENWDEVEMIIEARLAEMQSNPEDKQINKVSIEKHVAVQQPKSHVKYEILPEGLKVIQRRIEYKSFEGIIFPSSANKIENIAFISCSSLKTIDFSQCTQLEEIGDNAFYGCIKLESVILPPALKRIGKSSFRICSSLKTIDFSQCTQLEEIGDHAFYGCIKLESVILPPALKRIGEEFYNCSSLKTIDFSQCTQLEEIGDHAFRYSILESVILPPALKRIGRSAFLGCSSLKTIDFSQCTQLEEIGDQAFYQCALKEIVIPDSVEVIGRSAFASNKLESATIGKLAKNYFYEERQTILGNNPYLKELTFRSKVAEYTGAKSLTSVCFDDTVKELGTWAVAECSNLEKVVIPESVEKIGYGAFFSCKELSSIELSDNITEIEDHAFANTNLKEISFPKKLEKLGRLGEIEKLRKLDFSKVTQLEVIPDKFIGFNTPKLKELELPIGIKKIGEDIGGKKLNRLFLPPTIQEVEDLHQFNLDIYCFAPKIEELGLMIESCEYSANAYHLYVLPQYLDLYKAQREAEDVSEDLLIIDVIPDEYLYFYDN